MEKRAILEGIMDRRSIRKYTGERVPDEVISELLKTAMYAPSAVNKRPWHFIVTADRSLFLEIMDFHPYASFLDKASHVILVCGDEHLQHDHGYYVADCGAATENLLLAAHFSGLGACWIGVHPREERKKNFRKLFGLPDHIQPYALVSVGYPAEKKERPDRFEREKIHVDHWDKQPWK